MRGERWKRKEQLKNMAVKAGRAVTGRMRRLSSLKGALLSMGEEISTISRDGGRAGVHSGSDAHLTLACFSKGYKIEAPVR